MGEKNPNQVTVEGITYKLIPPDGGWGWVIGLSTFIVYACTVVPMNSFGLIYGKFLASIGDETTGTILSNGIFNTVMSLMGLAANVALNKYTYRKVGLVGTVLFCIGSTGIIFSQTLIQFILFYGIIQGIGFGLMMPAVLSALNSYFVQKMTLVMSLAQALMRIYNMLIPLTVPWIIETFGYRGILLTLTALTFLGFPANIVLQPVKGHMKKVPLDDSMGDTVVTTMGTIQSSASLSSKEPKDQIAPLLNERQRMISQRNLHKKRIQPKITRSAISLCDGFASVTAINSMRDDGQHQKNAESSVWRSLMESMDMSLLKDIKYLNISIGLALSNTSDVAFISIIPVMLGSSGFTLKEIASIVTVYFGADLTGRILLTIASGIFTFKSRKLVLMAALFSTIFRTVLFFRDEYMWKMCILAVLGFLRSFIQTPLTVVISEEYTEQFPSAFSLYMAINGIISLAFGLLTSVVKSYTQSDAMVAHVLTVAYAICVVSWIIELVIYRKKSGNEEENRKNNLT